MWNTFSLQTAKLDKIFLMRRKSQSADTYWDFIRMVGAPNKCITDNAKEFKCQDWMRVNRLHCITVGYSEVKHQNHNLAERRGGDLKMAVLKLFNNTPTAPLRYWCYALEFITFVRYSW